MIWLFKKDEKKHIKIILEWLAKGRRRKRKFRETLGIDGVISKDLIEEDGQVKNLLLFSQLNCLLRARTSKQLLVLNTLLTDRDIPSSATLGRNYRYIPRTIKIRGLAPIHWEDNIIMDLKEIGVMRVIGQVRLRIGIIGEPS